MTLFGFAAGLLAMGAITHHSYWVAAMLFLVNRLADGLDGAIARHSQTTDFGGVLDIACDFIIYAGIVFAFGLADHENLFYACFLLFSFIGPITTFLAYAIVAAKQKKNTTTRGIKSFYHLGGICEGTEDSFCFAFDLLLSGHLCLGCQLSMGLFVGSQQWVAFIRLIFDFGEGEALDTESAISREPKYGQIKYKMISQNMTM